MKIPAGRIDADGMDIFRIDLLRISQRDIVDLYKRAVLEKIVAQDRGRLGIRQLGILAAVIGRGEQVDIRLLCGRSQIKKA